MRIVLLLLAFTAVQYVEAQPGKKPGKTSSPCNSSRLPVVFVHGFLASGDTWALQAQRLVANGYCPERIFAYDWNTINNAADQAAKLDSFINRVLLKTGASKINLVAHSAGGGLCYRYCSDSVRAGKVSRYMHIAAAPQKAPAGYRGQIPTLNIFSAADRVVTGADMTIPGALNLQFKGYDHLQTATADSVFDALYRFFNSANVATKPAAPTTQPLSLSGRAVYLGDNQPVANTSIAVYEWDNVKAERSRGGKPVKQLFTDSSGHWTGFDARPGQYYEMQFRGGEKERLISYFFEPFTAPDALVYLRAYPLTGMTGALLAKLPATDEQALTAVFTANQACVAGRDRLQVNDSLISTAVLMPAGKSSIACFLFDDGDHSSSYKKNGLLANMPFMTSADVYAPPGGQSVFRIVFNGRQINIRARPAKTGGVSVVVFK